MRRFFIFPLAILAPLLAHAEPGWGWDEIQSREWSDATLEWAVDIHPEYSSTVTVEQQVAPPPREMWCVENSGVDDTPQDCNIYFDLLDAWTVNYLELGLNEPIPPRALEFTPECASACFFE